MQEHKQLNLTDMQSQNTPCRVVRVFPVQALVENWFSKILNITVVHTDLIWRMVMNLVHILCLAYSDLPLMVRIEYNVLIIYHLVCGLMSGGVSFLVFVFKFLDVVDTSHILTHSSFANLRLTCYQCHHIFLFSKFASCDSLRTKAFLRHQICVYIF